MRLFFAERKRRATVRFRDLYGSHDPQLNTKRNRRKREKGQGRNRNGNDRPDWKSKRKSTLVHEPFVETDVRDPIASYILPALVL